MTEIEINGFKVILNEEDKPYELKSYNWFVYPVTIATLPDGSKSMPRDTLDLLPKQEILGEEIMGVESFAKGTVRVGDVVGIAVKNRLTNNL